MIMIPISLASSVCLMREAVYDKTRAYFEYCPCEAELQCVPDGKFEVPLGEEGTVKPVNSTPLNIAPSL
jgi:hypothetical protein